MAEKIVEIRPGMRFVIDEKLIDPHTDQDYLKVCQVLKKDKCSGDGHFCHLCEFKDEKVLDVLIQKQTLKAQRF
jgi:hypothetical protein